jgi:hypothetical protein
MYPETREDLVDGYVTIVVRKGHIRPFCFKLYGYLERYQQANI